MRIRNKRKKLLYILLGLMILGTVGIFGGIQYVKYRFFGDSPNTLTFHGELHPVPFEWSEEQFDEYTEPHAAMLIPVTVPGLANKFYMQFDTGSASTFLRSGVMEPLHRRGIEFELFEEDDQTRVRKFELNIGGNQVFLNSSRVRGRDAEIDWDDPDAVNIIGTIGADFIDQKICEIDFPARELRLYKYRPEAIESLGSFTPFKFKGRRIMLPAVIDGVEMELFYDSGCSAFGLLTSKYHFEKYKNQDAAEISHNANRHGDPVFIHHQPCDSVVTFGDVDLPIKRVSYAELYTFLQNTVGRLVNGGVLGNKSLIESTLILDAKVNEFLIAPQSNRAPVHHSLTSSNAESEN